MNQWRYCFALFLFLNSCNQTDNKKEVDNIMTISSDIESLKEYVNLTEYNPKQVEWKWKTGSSKSEYELNAVIVFDSIAVEEIKENYIIQSTKLYSLNKNDFKFDWIKDNRIKLIESYNSTVYGVDLFKKGVLNKGNFIIIDNKTILLNIHY